MPSFILPHQLYSFPFCSAFLHPSKFHWINCSPLSLNAALIAGGSMHPAVSIPSARLTT